MALMGVRVMIVEDEPLLRLNLEDMLTDMGCVIAGSEGTVAGALKLAESIEVDIAVLDINIGGKRIDPVCHALAQRNIPFILTTGYDEDGLHDRGIAAAMIEKPYTAEALQTALETAVASQRGT